MTENKQTLICLDLEGVLVPEIWHGVAATTGIEELRLTTRDIADYDELMQHRLQLLDKHQLTLTDIQAVIATLVPLAGAKAFLDKLRQHYQVIILSDTFNQFARPLMQQLDMPTIFCHQLVIADDGHIINYHLRQRDHKRHCVEAFQNLNYRVLAAGDSYNDLSMLKAADSGFFFRPPAKITLEQAQFSATESYSELTEWFNAAAN